MMIKLSNVTIKILRLGQNAKSYYSEINSVKLNFVLLLLFFSVTLISLNGILQAYAEEPDSVTIQEWNIPTPDSVPHDVVVGTDGMIWFT